MRRTESRLIASVIALLFAFAVLHLLFFFSKHDKMQKEQEENILLSIENKVKNYGPSSLKDSGFTASIYVLSGGKTVYPSKGRQSSAPTSGGKSTHNYEFKVVYKGEIFDVYVSFYPVMDKDFFEHFLISFLIIFLGTAYLLFLIVNPVSKRKKLSSSKLEKKKRKKDFSLEEMKEDSEFQNEIKQKNDENLLSKNDENKDAFFASLALSLSKAKKNEANVSLLLMEFHAKKDEQTSLYDIISELFKEEGEIFALESELFAVIFHGENEEAAEEAASKLIEAVHTYSTAQCFIGISSKAKRNVISEERLYYEAEQALKKAKKDLNEPIVSFRVDEKKYENFLKAKRLNNLLP